MKFTIALIGRSNVGKSSLFNFITKNKSLVADYHCLTRDRQYGTVKIDKYKFSFIDTGSISTINNSNSEEFPILEQIHIAISESDILFFIVDAHSGVIPEDQYIANHLRSFEKVTLLVVNKVDNPKFYSNFLDFYTLGIGKKIYPISVSHGYGINNLLIDVCSIIRNNSSKFRSRKLRIKKLVSSYDSSVKPIRLVIAGRRNVGKSTLVNYISGANRVLVSNIPGTTRDAIYISIKHNCYEYTLIDTAGIQKRHKSNDFIERLLTIQTMKVIKSADVTILVMDVANISKQDISLLGSIIETGCALIIVINKWDTVSDIKKEHIKQTIKSVFSFVSFVKICFISALYNKGVESIFRAIKESYKWYSMNNIKSSDIMRAIHTATCVYQPPLVKGYKVKFTSVYIKKSKPPIIVISGKYINKLSNSYKKYLINFFNKSFNIVGIKIHMQFKED